MLQSPIQEIVGYLLVRGSCEYFVVSYQATRFERTRLQDRDAESVVCGALQSSRVRLGGCRSWLATRECYDYDDACRSWKILDRFACGWSCRVFEGERCCSIERQMNDSILEAGEKRW
jgi:hypothetical protein